MLIQKGAYMRGMTMQRYNNPTCGASLVVQHSIDNKYIQNAIQRGFKQLWYTLSFTTVL